MMRDRSYPVELDTVDSHFEADESNDSFVRFWLLVLRNYRNCGADERVQIDLSMMLRLCLFLRLC